MHKFTSTLTENKWEGKHTEKPKGAVLGVTVSEVGGYRWGNKDKACIYVTTMQLNKLLANLKHFKTRRGYIKGILNNSKDEPNYREYNYYELSFAKPIHAYVSSLAMMPNEETRNTAIAECWDHTKIRSYLECFVLGANLYD